MVRRLPWWGGYTVAVAGVVIIALVRLAMEHIFSELGSPFLLFVIGIVAAAWTGGLGPGVFSTILSLVVIVVVFLEPRMTPRVDEAQHYQSMLIFSLQGLVLAGLGESNLRALRGMSRLASELETRVERRTAQLAMANHQLMDEVHQRTEAERKLQHERNFLAALLESLQDGILACDENREVSLFNRAVREFFGLPPEPVPPQRWAEHYSLYEADGVTPLPPERQPLLRAFEEGQVENAEMVVVARSGRRRVLRVNGRAIHDEGGQRIGAVVSLQDITAQVEAERKVQAALAELRRSNKELQDFASVASHDLQEPLRKIQAFGDRLKATQGERLNDQGRDYLERMHNAAYRMGVLINDLLAFSRVTTRAQPFATVDLSQVAREVLGDLEDRLERTQGRVELGPLPAIEADPTQMRQLIQNLLSNALKFHKPGVPPVVHLREAPLEAAEADWVAIEVSDNGIGFEEKYLDRIFGIFQRLHGRGEYEGTGVGLAVCRKIVERHGGRITARSAPGAGTTFTVTLPRRPSNHPHEQPQAHYDPAGR